MEGGAGSTPAAVCSFGLCDSPATYAFQGDVATLCERHQPISPVEALEQVCHSRGCVNRVSHGWERDGVPSSCAAHIAQGMVQMRGVPCEFPCCRSAPVPAAQGEAPGRRCKAHMTSPLLGKPLKDTAAGAGENQLTPGQQTSSSGDIPEMTQAVADGKIAAPITRKGSSSSKRPRGRASKAAALAAAAAEVERTDMKATKKRAPAGGGGSGSSGGGGGSSGSRQSATLTCESRLCNKNPSFGYRGQTRRRFCKRHAEPGMVNVYYRYCGADGDRCPERASFEADGKLRCLQHREPGMRPRNKICQVEGGGCTRQSSFGVEGGKPVLCTLHKKPGMVQVRTKTCRHPGCDKIPSYGYPCKSREFCKPHALEGMVYSAGSRCRFRGCELPGVFNYPWSARGGSFCGIHKEGGMVDMTPKRCESVGCKYAANFGDTTQRTRRFCARHKLGEMLSYQELWPKPEEKVGNETPRPTKAEKALAADLAATAAAPPSTVSLGQPPNTGNTDSAETEKRQHAHQTPPPLPPPPPGGPSTTLQHPESRGFAGVEQVNFVGAGSTPTFDGMPPVFPLLAPTTAAPGAKASAARASSAMDLEFLANAATSATPTSGALGGHPTGGLHESPAAVRDLSGSQAPENSDDTPLPWSQEDFSIGASSTATANAGTADAGVGAFNGVSMPPVTALPTSSSLDDESVDMMGRPMAVEDDDETEEGKFLANLVNSIDPTDPKTFRVRGAMLSRLKNVGRDTAMA